MEHVCNNCGAQGVKLWREYQTFLNEQTLLCSDCTGISTGKKYLIGQDGRAWSDLMECWNDSVEFRVPAVPTDDGTFLGFTSVPYNDVVKWRRLPNRNKP